MKNYLYYLKKEQPQKASLEACIGMAGNCSTEALAKVFRGYFADHDIRLNVVEAPYDTVNLSVLDESSPFYQQKLSFLVLYFSPLKLRDDFHKSLDKKNFAAQFIADFKAAIHVLKSKNVTALVTSMPTSIENLFGNNSVLIDESFLSQIESINRQLKEIVKQNRNCLLLDIEFLANKIGLRNFHSDKLWHMGKYPCHTDYYPDIASNVFSVFQALNGNIKKVIVLDLDNTIWGGLIGEDGLDGIEVFTSFQYFLKTLKESGYLLAVCSKNDSENAVLPFRKHPEMVLKEDDITVFMANWEPKSENLKRISTTLNLGLDSFIFIDDSAFERNEVRHSLPMVLVPELPEDPTEYVSCLLEAKCFEKLNLTALDKDRTEQYRQETKRKETLASATNIDDYLKSLNMVCKVEKINSSNVERASQLIQRSNQFNLRTQRLSKTDLEKFSSFCFSLKDKFGDSGIIAVVVCEKINESLVIRELVMSCRVLKRGMESLIFNFLIDAAKAQSLKEIQGEYIPTDKNSMVANLLAEYGFKDGSLSVKEDSKTKNFIRQDA